MSIFEATMDGKEVMMEFNGEGTPCHLYIRYAFCDLVKIDSVFETPSKLSASLRCELGYTDSCWFLHKAGIDKASRLWDLNHDGYPGDKFFEC